MKRILVALVAMLVLASTAWTQSLAELAKKEEARRRAVKVPAKVLTNEDLKKFERATPPDAPKPDPAVAKDPAAADAATGEAARQDVAKAEADKLKGQEEVKDEAWWHNRITDARAALERNRLMADALQSRINQLWADFTAAAGPIKQRELGEERQKAIDELGRLKKEMEAQKQGIADIETEARQAGVPPGWLR
jgi:chromosome segregation ATPase